MFPEVVGQLLPKDVDRVVGPHHAVEADPGSHSTRNTSPLQEALRAWTDILGRTCYRTLCRSGNALQAAFVQVGTSPPMIGLTAFGHLGSLQLIGNSPGEIRTPVTRSLLGDVPIQSLGSLSSRPRGSGRGEVGRPLKHPVRPITGEIRKARRAMDE